MIIRILAVKLLGEGGGGAIKKFLACMNKTRMLYGTVFVTISSHWLKIADILDGNK